MGSVERICRECGGPLPKYAKILCSHECRKASARAYYKEKAAQRRLRVRPVDMKCASPECDVIIPAGSNADRRKRYCSVACYDRGTYVIETAHLRPGEKQCVQCGKVKPGGMFNRAKKSEDGLAAWCRQCSAEAYSSNRPFAEVTRESRIVNLYKRPIAWYYAECDKGCAICGRLDGGEKAFAIDHDHRCCPGIRSCGECVRGVLCSTCNSALGLFQDSVDVLQSAVDYLRRNEKKEN